MATIAETAKKAELIDLKCFRLFMCLSMFAEFVSSLNGHI